MKFYTFFRKKDRYHVALCKMQTKHDRIRDGNIETRILHKTSEILVYKTSGHKIFHHIPPISWARGRRRLLLFNGFNGVLFTQEIPKELILLSIDYGVACRLRNIESQK